MLQENHLQSLSNIGLNKQELKDILYCIDNYNFTHSLKDESYYEGICNSLRNLSLYFSGNENSINIFSKKSYYELPLEAEILKNNPYEKELKDFIFEFGKIINKLSKNKKANLGKELKLFFRINMERYDKYIHSGLNTPSSIYYLSQLEINKKILIGCFYL
jgi:hypothetical protein